MPAKSRPRSSRRRRLRSSPTGSTSVERAGVRPRSSAAGSCVADPGTRDSELGFPGSYRGTAHPSLTGGSGEFTEVGALHMRPRWERRAGAQSVIPPETRRRCDGATRLGAVLGCSRADARRFRVAAFVRRPCHTLGQKPVADRPAALDSGRHGEERAAGVHDVLVQGVVGGEPSLDRDELPPRVALEGDEEQPGVELAGLAGRSRR